MKKDEKEIRLTIKKRLKSIRGKETQEVFAKRVLGDSDRGRWANWESTSKTNIGRLPQLEDFAIICENADVSADYLIGKDHININDSKLISNVLHISEGGVIELRKNKSINNFFDFLLSNSKTAEIIDKMDIVWTHNVTIEPSETLFTSQIVKKADQELLRYANECGVWDITCDDYAQRLNITFLEDENFNVNTKELQMYMENLYPDFNEMDKFKQFSLKIYQLAELRFLYYIKKQQLEILKSQIADEFKHLIDKYIQHRTDTFLNRNRK